jgi:hypothetical protein
MQIVAWTVIAIVGLVLLVLFVVDITGAWEEPLR